MKVVPFGIQRCNKLPKGGNNDSIWVMLWMEPLQKISMILLSTCSPPGRVQRERLQMKITTGYHIAMPRDRWISPLSQDFTGTR